MLPPGVMNSSLFALTLAKRELFITPGGIKEPHRIESESDSVSVIKNNLRFSTASN